ncbi:hypothetical protein, partial [Acetobacter orleanensis]|uniref:hypothetical protein n=1 Tax=Acetobacter orleanensis TaxID=104099 RepID=UPI00222E1859
PAGSLQQPQIKLIVLLSLFIYLLHYLKQNNKAGSEAMRQRAEQRGLKSVLAQRKNHSGVMGITNDVVPTLLPPQGHCPLRERKWPTVRGYTDKPSGCAPICMTQGQVDADWEARLA